MGYCWAMYEDQEAALWFGAERGGVRYKDGMRTHFTTKDGLAFFSLRSRRKHKAWGASPRIEPRITIEPAKRATALAITKRQSW